MAYSKSYGKGGKKKPKGAGSTKLHPAKNKHISKPKIKGKRKTP